MALIEKKYLDNHFKALFEVENSDAGMRLDQYCQKQYPSLTRAYIQKKIKDGEVTIIGRPGKIRASMCLLYKDVMQVIVKRMDVEDEYWRGEKLTLKLYPDIVYEDDDLVVISKPPYMAAHPTGRHIFNSATVYFEKLYGKNVHSVHRLDREISGIMMLAKNPKTAAQITTQFENETVKKVYFFIAEVRANFRHENFIIAKERLSQLEDDDQNHTLYVEAYPENSKLGRHATTFLKVLHLEKGYCLGLAFPQTGRQHQIRVHAMTHGLPLIGDKMYFHDYELFKRFKDNIASDEDHDLMQIPRHALHAVALALNYQGHQTQFITHIPHDFTEWIQKHLAIDIKNVEAMIKHEITEYFSKISK